MEYEHDDSIRTILRRALFRKVDDSKSQQKVDLSGLKSERMEKIVRIQAHGFTSNPPKDSEAVIIQLGGRSDRTMVFGGEHKDHRPKDLEPGESAFYDAFTKVLKFFKDKTEWKLGNKPLVIKDATTIEISGSQRVSVGVAGMWIKITPTRIDLAVSSATGTATHKVETEGGPSSKVYAEI
jgi:phage gp45-like